jgi:tryptophan 7-halogenase
MDFEYTRIRDFIILHYKLGRRDDSPFWRWCRDMDVPRSLIDRMDLFKRHGRIFREGLELFTPVGWLQVMHGQGLKPEGYHPLVDLFDEAETMDFLGNIRDVIGKCVEVMPSHADYIAKNCAAPRM